MEKLPIANRLLAGRELAKRMQVYKDRHDVIAIALPRGGVPVAYEIANILNIPLDVIIVRKLGLPGQEEFAMGAIASGGVEFLDSDIVSRFDVPTEKIKQIREQQLAELDRREQIYRGSKKWPVLKKKSVILIDDGLATGATMRAAIHAVRDQGAKKIIVAVPVAPAVMIQKLSFIVDECICLATPSPFNSVGQWYVNFSQTTDMEVCKLLAVSRQQKWQREKLSV
ncbi:MAG: phosphoribosyltransferase [Moraxellaceae bacterium]|nr:MAG: phosphoribosyltransferase [Moraxellaceae bacterium]